MLTKDQSDVLAELADNTHAFWPPHAVKQFTTPFGFEGKCHVEVADHKDPKGLRFAEDHIRAAEGAATWDVTGQIVNHLGITRTSCLGRGFQVRRDVDDIRKHLNK